MMICYQQIISLSKANKIKQIVINAINRIQQLSQKMDTSSSYLCKSTIPIKEYSNKFLRQAKSKDSLPTAHEGPKYKCWRNKAQIKKKFYTCKLNPMKRIINAFQGELIRITIIILKMGEEGMPVFAAHAKQSAKIGQLLSMDNPQQIVSLPGKTANKIAPTTPLSKLSKPSLLIPCKISTSRGLELFSKVYAREKQQSSQKNKIHTIPNQKKIEKHQPDHLEAKQMVLVEKDRKCNQPEIKSKANVLMKHVKKFNADARNQKRKKNYRAMLKILLPLKNIQQPKTKITS